jgi:intracellular sulfur oxidation DsrE/DsrF family protein
MKFLQSVLQRRSFVGLGSRAAALAATVGGGASVLHAQSASAGRWEPAREVQDDWLDNVPGKHRMLFDATTPEAFGYALLFAGNYFIANHDAYGIQDTDLAVVIVARHHATPFAFNDAMWKKYGEPLSRLMNFVDPRTKSAPTSNLFNVPLDVGLPNRGGTIDALVKRGAQFAVCQMATRQLADTFAETGGGKGEDVFKELSANLVANSRLVAAGIVAVNRAQERGYTFVHA